MKIALAQLNYHIGNFSENTHRIIRCIERAKKKGADLVVFAELAVCGYPPRDFLEFDDFIVRCRQSVEEIARECIGITAIIGCPERNTTGSGKDLFNTAFVLGGGLIQSVHHKTLLPNYDVFDEYRYFEPGRNPRCAAAGETNVAVTICEDLWNLGEVPMYTASPMESLKQCAPALIVNIAASPFHAGQAAMRRHVLCTNARQYGLPVFYVNHVGAQTELLFDGGSMAVSPGGQVFNEMKYFEEDFRVFDLEEVIQYRTKKHGVAKSSGIERIHDALVMGIRDYFSKLGFKEALLGLSGGIDSAVVLALAAEALGPSNVHAYLLPSRFSSDHSIEDARALAENTGCPYEIISIEDAFKSFEKTLQPFFSGTPEGLAEENIQARARALILMALSNKFGYVLLNTSNKSEAAVGYGTLYGDMCGGISVLGDVYKTQVYELASFINRKREIIPANTILKPPSAELRHDQKDTDSLPEYEMLDKILHAYIEQRKGPNDIIALGFDKATVDRVLKMVNTSEYKRYQTPPILRVSPKAFGMGRRLPIVARYLA
jgi:NAD+ synthase (glutamine-hydrolysing)